MIYINLSVFKPSDDWLLRAWFLVKELEQIKNQEARYAFIDANRGFWSEIKDELPFSDKCWYSEAKESVSVYEIEHFRPVNGTSRISKNVLRKMLPLKFEEKVRKDWIKESRFRGGGYWWLAFNYLNFRNSGKRVNLVKSTRFPLQQNSFIAYSNDDDYGQEDVILLDPTRQGDPDLLTFDPDGKARPTTVDVTDMNYLRAIVSIEIYGLNKIDALVKHRETKWSDCHKAIRRAIEKYSEIEEANENGNLSEFHRRFDELMDFIENDIKPAIREESEFSSVAKACVGSYSNHSWLNEYIYER